MERALARGSEPRCWCADGDEPRVRGVLIPRLRQSLATQLQRGSSWRKASVWFVELKLPSHSCSLAFDVCVLCAGEPFAHISGRLQPAARTHLPANRAACSRFLLLCKNGPRAPTWASACASEVSATPAQGLVHSRSLHEGGVASISSSCVRALVCDGVQLSKVSPPAAQGQPLVKAADPPGLLQTSFTRTRFDL
eukprot:scaffold5834_cov376-Prasinococcus_capsulatus_cf.AAC.2